MDVFTRNGAAVPLLGAALLAFAAPAQAADYLPVGVQNNVSVETVIGGGWTQCFLQSYGAAGPSLASILEGCSGSRLMLAGRATGSDTLMVLAQAAFSDVTFDIGLGNATHNANDVEWYFDENSSWGFAPGGSAVSRSSCDTVDSSFSVPGPTSAQRLCWHTSNGEMSGGWRVGAADQLNNSDVYEKVIYTFVGSVNGAVPEPGTWLLMILGFGAIGGMMRSRKRQTVTVGYA